MRRFFSLLLLGLLALAPLPVHATITLEYLVLMTFVEGETTQTLEFNLEERVNGSDVIIGAGPGGGPHIRRAQLIKRIGPESPTLFALKCSGAEIQGVTITQTMRNDETPDVAPQYIFELDNVLISSYSVGGTSGSGLDDGSIPTETLSLNFDKITWRYWPLGPIGPGVDEISGELRGLRE